MADTKTELAAMEVASIALQKLDGDQQRRVIQWLIDSLGIGGIALDGGSPSGDDESYGGDSGVARRAVESNALNATDIKAFMKDKQPKSMVERIACLAYYLAEREGVAAFRSPDIVKANTRAALSRIGNAPRDVTSAERDSGFLASAGGGRKQITARGEALVTALPDREAVKEALRAHPIKRRAKKAGGKKAAKKLASAATRARKTP